MVYPQITALPRHVLYHHRNPANMHQKRNCLEMRLHQILRHLWKDAQSFYLSRCEEYFEGGIQSPWKLEHFRGNSQKYEDAKKREGIKLLRNQPTYTERDVPITTNASTLSRSASRVRLTLSLKLSPKNVTPGLKTPPHSFAPDSRCRFLVL